MSRRNPFDELERMLDRMSEQFGQEFGEIPGQRRGPAIDVAERDDEIVVTADLPGYEREDIAVTLRDGDLRIEAGHRTESEQTEGDYVRRERRQEAVSRSVSLPVPVDEDGTSATYTNGVLTVSLPKVDREQGGRSIDIE